MILIVSDIFPHINCFRPFLHAFLHCVPLPEIKPGFLPANKPGFTGLKTGGLFGFSGTRVAFPSLWWMDSTKSLQHDIALHLQPLFNRQI